MLKYSPSLLIYVPMFPNEEWLHLMQLLRIIYEKKKIDFSEQRIYKTEDYFKNEMQKLVRMRWVEVVNGFHITENYTSVRQSYVLTLPGKLIAETAIVNFYERNPR